MTHKKVHLIMAGVFLVITVVGCVVAGILFPPVLPAVAVVGGGIVTWFIEKSLDKVAEHMTQETTMPNIPSQYIGENLQQRTRTIHKHYSETDIEGHHISDDIRETIIEDDPPPRPKKPGLTRDGR